MAPLVLAIVIVFTIVAAAFHAIGYRVPGCWLLVLSAASLCIGIIRDLCLGVRQIGQAAIDDDHNHLMFCLVLLVLSLLATLRTNWLWFFWIVLTLNTMVCAVLLYIVFFWKVFS